MLHFAKVVLGSYALSRLYWNACAAESTGTERHSHGAVITPAPTLRNQLQRRSIATCAYVRGNSGMCSSRGLEVFKQLKKLILFNFVALPLTCPDGYNCINSLAIQPAWACCNDIECLGNWGLCNEYGASGCGGVNLDTNLCSSIYRAPILQWSVLQPHKPMLRNTPDNLSVVRKQIHTVSAMLEVPGSEPRKHTIPGRAGRTRRMCSLLCRLLTGTTTQTLTRRLRISFPSPA